MASGERLPLSTDYETIAASQADQILGPTGKVGDVLEVLVITVNTAATAAVSIKDGDGAAIGIMPNSPGGGIGVYTVRLGARCNRPTTPGWKVTTGAGSTALAIGKFS